MAFPFAFYFCCADIPRHTGILRLRPRGCDDRGRSWRNNGDSFAVRVPDDDAVSGFRLSRGRARVAVSSVLLGLAFFPPIVFLFPLYELVRLLGLINHPWGLIIPYTALNLPLSIWLLTGYFRQIPVELEEAAEMDGLTPLQTYFTI